MKSSRWFFAAVFILSTFVWLIASGQDDESRRTALRGLIERAENGDAKALYDLAVLHDTGFDTIPVDSARSTALYRLSAEKGYAPARNYLGYRYFNGEYVRQDMDSAMYWLVAAAADGDMKAANNLGYLLSNDSVVTHDYEQAIYWLEKASGAGVPTAHSLLADLLRQGLGTAPDTLRAIGLYNSAIESGLQDAELKLLSMMGRKWETLPADSALSLGRYYYTHRAPFIGVTLFENVAAQENPEALALLGDAYSRALGVEYNHEKSIEYFLHAALLGQPSAQFVIGELIDIFPDALSAEPAAGVIKDFFESLGESVPEDISTPPYWYDRAAEGGVTDAESAAILLLEP